MNWKIINKDEFGLGFICGLIVPAIIYSIFFLVAMTIIDPSPLKTPEEIERINRIRYEQNRMFHRD